MFVSKFGSVKRKYNLPEPGSSFPDPHINNEHFLSVTSHIIKIKALQSIDETGVYTLSEGLDHFILVSVRLVIRPLP